MSAFLRHLAALYQRHSIEMVIVGILLGATLFIQIGSKFDSHNWLSQWEFYHRIRLGRFNHGQREVLYWHRHGTWVHMPYIGVLARQLQDRDSISKKASDMHLYVLRDSASYRLTIQYAWNETTHEFEFVGRSKITR